MIAKTFRSSTASSEKFKKKSFDSAAKSRMKSPPLLIIFKLSPIGLSTVSQRTSISSFAINICNLE